MYINMEFSELKEAVNVNMTQTTQWQQPLGSWRIQTTPQKEVIFNLLSLETPRGTGISHTSKKNVTKPEKSEQTEDRPGFGH